MNPPTLCDMEKQYTIKRADGGAARDAYICIIIGRDGSGVGSGVTSAKSHEIYVGGGLIHIISPQRA